MRRKVISIILALSMLACMIPAGALTAMAATTPVAKIGSTTYTSFEDALKAAKGGDTITLLNDVSYGTNGSGLWNITKSITLDGGTGHSLNGWGSRSGNKTTLAINNGGSSKVNVTLKNLTINNAASAGRVIETRGNIGTLTLDNVIVNATGSGNTQSLTIGGSQSTSAAVVIKNQSEINAGNSGYPIIIFNPVNMTVEDSTLSGYCAVYFKAPLSSAGSANSVVLCDRAKILSPNAHPSNDGWNNFGAFVFEDQNGNTKVTLNDCEIYTPEENTAHQYIFAPNLGMVNGYSNIVSEITGDSTIVNTDQISKWPMQASFTSKAVVSGGIYSTNVSLEQLVAPGYKVINNPDTMTKEKYPYKVVPNDYNPDPDTDIAVSGITPEKKTEILNRAVDNVADNVADNVKETVKEAASNAVEKLTLNDEVTKIETKVEEAVKTEANAIITRAAAKAESAETGSGKNFTTESSGVKIDTKIEVKLETVNVDTQSLVSSVTVETVKFNKVVYDVKPIADVTTTFTVGGKTQSKTERVILTDDDLNGNKINVRLPVSTTDAMLAKVTHTSDNKVKYPTDEIFYATVHSEESDQYIDIEMTHFSEVEIETLTKTAQHRVGHQYRSDNEAIGRVIIPLNNEELAAIEDGEVTVVGGDTDKPTSFTVDCAYTYFYNGKDKVTAESQGVAAFIIIDKDQFGDDISGYGYYRLYKGVESDETFLFDTLFAKPNN